MLHEGQRRWPNINPPLGQRIVSIGIVFVAAACHHILHSQQTQIIDPMVV